ncbi:MAG TPA: toll/interleukin-1 receptor domain-containing protein [Longimicrobium sp.]|jgi:tetratricopeptide (TPR) repeat protein
MRIIRRIFLSYAREDLPWAQEQERVLSSAGIDVYLASKSNRAGDDFPQRIYDELAQADQVRLGWSRYSAQSDWVRREYLEALRISEARGLENFLLVDLLDEETLAPELQHIQAERWVLAGRDVHRLLKEPYHRVDEGRLPSPSALLLPKYRVARFQGRKEEMDAAEAWCNSDPLFDVALYVGQGGSGKTRFSAELCVRMIAQGWDAGFLSRERADEALQTNTKLLDYLLEPRVRTLVVVDYAESRRNQVAALLRRGLDKRTAAPVRLLLLARNAGEWWRELLKSDQDFLLRIESTRAVHLRPLAPRPEERKAVYDDALEAFGRELSLPVPEHRRTRFETAEMAHPLFLHAAALLDVQQAPATPSAELVTGVLAHEERHWKGVAEQAGLSGGEQAFVSTAMALVSLAGGVEQRNELHALLARHPALAGQAGVLYRRQLGEVLRCLYGWEGRIEPLQPDRVGEALVTRELERDSELREGWHTGATPQQLRNGLVLLGRIASQQPNAHEWLVDVLSAALAERAEAARDVALEGSEPVALALRDALRRRSDPSLAQQVLGLIPDETVALAEVAVEVARQALDPTTDEFSYAEALNSFAERLKAVGEYGEALKPALQAAEIRRSLAEREPDTEHDRKLSTSLNSLAEHYGRLAEATVKSDRGKDGAPAVRHMRQLALESAQEAVEIRRRLATAHPDRFTSVLATSLNNLGIRWREVGQRANALAAARESTEFRRRFAHSDPKQYLPQLATSLNSMAMTLIRVEEGSGAVPDESDLFRAFCHAAESTRIRRDLSEEKLDAFLPALADSLDTLAAVLEAAGALGTSLEAAELAGLIYERTASVYPRRYADRLRDSQQMHGRILAALKERDGAAIGSLQVEK